MTECSDIECQSSHLEDINSLYKSIKCNPRFLQEMDECPFIHTPLHDAAVQDQAHLAIEIMNLMPSLGKKLNPDGRTPLHLAVENNSVTTAKALVKLDRELVRVKGKECLKPVHLAAERNQEELLACFMINCPDSIKDQNVRFQTPLQVALKSNNYEAFRLLAGWIYRRERNNPILGWKDEDGNTALHLAVQSPIIYVKDVKQMAYNEFILNKRNNQGKTALDVAAEHGKQEMVETLKNFSAKKGKDLAGKKPMSKYLQSGVSYVEGWSRDNYEIRRKLGSKTDIMLIVAVLVATATYQAALQPPGGLYQASAAWVLQARAGAASTKGQGHGHQAGKMVMSERHSRAFLATNMVAFVLSVFVIIKVLYSSLKHFYAPLYGSLFFMACSYVIGQDFIGEAGTFSVVVFVVFMWFIIQSYVGILAEDLEALIARTRRRTYSHWIRRYLFFAFPEQSRIIKRQNKVIRSSGQHQN